MTEAGGRAGVSMHLLISGEGRSRKEIGDDTMLDISL